MEDGVIRLTRTADGYDIVYTDATEATRSSVGDGAAVTALVTERGDIVVHLRYRTVWESYVFWMSDSQPTMTFSQARFGTPMRKHNLLVAKCRRGA
jgi:hypothetical protein